MLITEDASPHWQTMLAHHGTKAIIAWAQKPQPIGKIVEAAVANRQELRLVHQLTIEEIIQLSCGTPLGRGAARKQWHEYILTACLEELEQRAHNMTKWEERFTWFMHVVYYDSCGRQGSYARTCILGMLTKYVEDVWVPVLQNTAYNAYVTYVDVHGDEKRYFRELQNIIAAHFRLSR